MPHRVWFESQSAPHVVCKQAWLDSDSGLHQEHLVCQRLLGLRGVRVSLGFSESNQGRILRLAYVEGQTLDHWLATSPTPEIRQQLAINFLALLERVHQAGVWHFAIRPEHLIVGPNLEVTLIGWSRARLQIQGQCWVEPDDPAYMAPEQIKPQGVSRSLEVSCDLYCCGLVLYLLWSGGPVFPARSPRQWLTAHRNQIPEDLQRRAPDCPAYWAAVVQTLLAKEPERRFPSAQAALRAVRLGRGQPLLLRLSQLPFPSREPLRQRLDQAWAQAQNGTPGRILLEGPAGVGKSQLLRQWLTSPSCGSLGRCKYHFSLKAEQGLQTDSYWGLRQMLSQVLEQVEAPDLLQATAELWRQLEAPHEATLDFGTWYRLLLEQANPTLIVLEDLQWFDPVSLALFWEATWPEGTRLLLVGTCRVGEGPRSDGLRLPILPLDSQELQGWLDQALGQELPELSPLLYGACGGNPLHAMQLLTHWLESGQLEASQPEGGAERGWTCQALTQAPLHDDLVEVISNRLRQLPAQLRKGLAEAAALGGLIELELLSLADPKPLEQVALAAQLWVKVAGGYRFAHDRIQEAAQELLQPNQQLEVHRNLGRRLAQRPERSLQALRHLQRTGGAPELSPDLYLRGARQARISGLFQEAVSLAQTGLSLPIDPEQRLLLSQELHQALLLAGRRREATLLFEGLRSQGYPPLDLALAARSQIELLTRQYRFQEAVDLGFSFLQELQVAIPPPENFDHFRGLFEAWEQQFLATPWPTRPMPYGPEAENSRLSKAALILGAMKMAAFMVGLRCSMQIYLATLQLALDQGVVPEMAFAFCLLQQVQILLHHDYQRGLQWAEFGVRLSQSHRQTGQWGQNLFFYCLQSLPWRRPLAEVLATTRQARELLEGSGNLPFASYCYLISLEIALSTSAALGEISQEAQAALLACRRANDPSARELIELLALFVHSLQGQHDFELASHHLQVSNPKTQLYLGCYRAWWVYLEGRPASALEYLEQCRPLLVLVAGEQLVVRHLWLEAMVRAALGPSHLPRLQQLRQQFEVWHSLVPCSFAHRLALVEAEIAVLQGKAGAAMEGFERAIEAAHLEGFPLERALAQEHYASFWQGRHQALFAQAQWGEALLSFRLWGAQAKVERIAQRLGNPRLGLAGMVDLEIVLQASQALGQLTLDKHLVELLALIQEQTGARYGALLTRGERGWWLEAELNQDATQQATLLSLEADWLEECAQSKSLTHLSDKQLCLPLVHQGQLLALLYLENQQLSQAFPQQHLQLLSMLSGQLAMSLANARLYGDLEQQVAKRTQELSRAKDRALAAEEAKGNFLANMSHELRTPLNTILGFSHLCLQSTLGEQQRDRVKKISSAAQSLLEIVNDILDFSKIEAGKLHFEDIEFELEEVLQRLRDLFSLPAGEKNLELLFDLEPSLPPTLRGDPVRLAQVLINLFSNAIKFTQAGEVLLTVRLLSQEEQSLQLEFSVRDSGIGMAEEHLGRLFQPFTQADTSTTRRFGGSGLGLAICHSLVERMQGQIRCSSQLGQGSTFTFQACFGRVSQAQSGPSPARLSLKVLVVDDNFQAREVTRRLLQGFGYGVCCAESGTQALEKLAQQPNFDLVLLDWKMPEMDGLETARRIKQTFPRLRIILVTALESEPLLQAAHQLQLDGVLAKPLSPSSLYEASLEILATQALPVKIAPDQPAPTHLAGLKVLLVEDHEILQEMTCALLQAAGLEVDIAGNGAEALAQCALACYSGVLMDIQMPVMDGLQAARALRNQGYRGPIIALTANVFASQRELCLEAGMNDHIGKPFDIPQLYATLGRWLSPQAPPPPQAPELPPELKERLLRQFAEEHQGFGAQYRQASPEQRRFLAHRLAGVAGNLGQDLIYQWARQLEQGQEVLEQLEAALDSLQQKGLPLRTESRGGLGGDGFPLRTEDEGGLGGDGFPLTDEDIEVLDQLLASHDLQAAQGLRQLTVKNILKGSDWEQLQNLLDDFEFEKGQQLWQRMNRR